MVVIPVLSAPESCRHANRFLKPAREDIVGPANAVYRIRRRLSCLGSIGPSRYYTHESRDSLGTLRQGRSPAPDAKELEPSANSISPSRIVPSGHL